MTDAQLQAALAEILALPDGPEKTRKARQLRGLASLSKLTIPDTLKAFSDAPVLETVDLERVDIMAANERVYGTGSPPEGDMFTEDKLRELAARSQQYVDALKPANKISHSFDQTLAKSVGLTAGEMPALGWLTNYRVEPDDQQRPKIYVDIKGVPKKFAELVKVGAFRTRSPELRSRKVDGKDTGVVIDGLAWHGAQSSAFKTLDDVFMLYADEETYARAYAEAEAEGHLVQWAAINPDAAVEAAARLFGERITVKPARRDTYDQMSELTLTADQDAKLRKVLGLDEKGDIDPAKMFEALETQATAAETAEAEKKRADELAKKLGDDGKGDDGKGGEAAPTEAEKKYAEMDERLKAQEERVRTADQAQADKFFEDNVEGGKIEAATAEKLKKAYAEAPDEAARAAIKRSIEALPVNEEWKRVFGSDDAGEGGDDEDELYKSFAAMDGGPAPSLEKTAA